MLPFKRQTRVSKTYRLSQRTLQSLEELQRWINTNSATETIEAAIYYTYKQMQNRDCSTCALYDEFCDGGCTIEAYEECRNNFYRDWEAIKK